MCPFVRYTQIEYVIYPHVYMVNDTVFPSFLNYIIPTSALISSLNCKKENIPLHEMSMDTRAARRTIECGLRGDKKRRRGA